MVRLGELSGRFTVLESCESCRRGGPKFLPLTQYLRSQPASVSRLDTYIYNLIVIIRDELPPMAYHDLKWWANDAAHEQAAAWLEAGWKAADVDLGAGTVSFIRVT